VHVAHDVPPGLAGGLEGIEYGAARHAQNVAASPCERPHSSPRRSKLYKLDTLALGGAVGHGWPEPAPVSERVTTMTPPKLFISYSWSDPRHEQWVLGLAGELVQSGVDVILDKRDLKEGHDAIAFMEQMVTDAAIKKVAIICDEKYAAKADGRAGGVGTETQIISAEVYTKQAQEKFVAIVSEKDANGRAFLPTYYQISHLYRSH
jgi:hypothetical protein